MAGAIEFFEQALLHLPVAVMITDEGDVVRWTNQSFTVLTGYEQSDIVGLSAAFLTAESATDRPAGRRKNGERYRLEATRAPIAGASGGHAVWTLRDVGPETGSAAPACRDRPISGETPDLARRYEVLYDAMSEGVAIYRLVYAGDTPENYVLLDVNPQYEKIVGVKREDTVGRLGTDIYHSTTPPYLQEYAAAVRSRSAFQFETYFAPLDRYFVISVAPMSADVFATIFFDITEQRRTQEQYKLVSTNTADVIWLWSLIKERCVYVSPSVEKLRGFSPEEILGQSMMQAMPPDVYQVMSAATQDRAAAVEAGDEQARVATYEVPFLCKDGTAVLTETVTTILSDNRGKAEFVVGVSRNITERKQLQEAARESEEKFVKLFVSSPAVTVLFDLADGDRLLEVNNAFERFLGYQRDEVVGRTMTELELWNEPGERSRIINELLDKGKASGVEVHFRKKNGDIVLGLTGAELVTLNGRGCVLASTIDITQRKHDEQALRQSEEKFAKVFHASPTAKCINDIDDEYRFLNVNEAFEQATGHRREEVIGRRMSEIGWWTDPAERRAAEARVRQAGRLRNFEHRFRTKNGESGTGLLSAELIDIEGKRCALFTDAIITKRKQMEEAWRQSEERLRLTLEAAGVVAYEINPDGSYFEAGPVARLFGRTRGVRHQRIDDLAGSIHPEDRDRVMEAVTASLHGGEAYSVAFRVPLPGGGNKWIAANGAPLDQTYGKPARLLGVAVDITVRKLAEEELRKANLKLQLLADNLGETVFAYNMNRELVYVNPSVERLTGYSIEELRRENLICWIHPADQPRMMSAWENLFQGGSYTGERYRMITKGGSQRWVEASWGPLLDQAGHQVGVQGVERDITARQATEEVLLQTNIRLQLAATSGGLGIWEWDIKSDSLIWDDRMFELYGVSKDRFTGCYEAWRSGMHPDDRAGATAALEAALRDEGQYAPEFRVVHADGSVRHIKADGLVLRDERGRPVRMIGLNRDITELKLAAEELERMSQTVSLALRAGRAGAWEVNLETGELLWTREYRELMGVGTSFVPTVEAFLAMVHPEDRAALTGDIQRGAVRPAPFQNQFRVLLADGVHWMERRGNVQCDARGKALRIIGITADITERKQAEAEREKLWAQLSQAQKVESIGRLAGGVAHDFNNLLTVINGYCKLLLAGGGSDVPMQDGLREILKAGERAVGLTRQLLAFSRRQILHPRVLNLNIVVEEMRRMLERLVREDVEVCLSLCSEEVIVRADPHQLEQVIMNLAVNARDAMPKGGRLRIETSLVERDPGSTAIPSDARPGRFAVLEVIDTGVGMDEATRQRIFEPFFTTKRAGQGTGLGLSMVQGIVAQSGGSIDVFSETGHGTKFKIYLPALAGGVSTAEPAVAGEQLRGSQTILVVEDQAEVRSYAAAVLRGYGYRVIEASGAGEALMAYEKDGARIHLVLTDVVMPHISGRELIDRLAGIQPGLKSIFMSGYTDDAIVHHGVLERGVNFIQKPFSPEELARKVRAVFDSQG